MRLKILFSLIISVSAICSCNSKTDPEAMPGVPATIKAVEDEIKGNKYEAEKAGTHSLFKDDNSIEWLEPKEENKFEKKIADESKSLRFDFINDTAITVAYNNKTYEGTYRLDENTGEDEKPGIKLRVSYTDEDFKLGNEAASVVTYTYLVEGISNAKLLLETPRSMNNRKIVVLMKKL